MMRPALILGAVLTLYTGTQAGAQDEDLKSGTLAPRTALMSEEVARQKLATYGVGQVQELTVVGDTYAIRGTYEGRPVELLLHRVTGQLREKGSAALLTPARTSGVPVIRDSHIKVDRRELVRPELLGPALEPKQP